MASTVHQGRRGFVLLKPSSSSTCRFSNPTALGVVLSVVAVMVVGCDGNRPAAPGTDHWEVAAIWGGNGSGPGQLKYPLGLCLDAQGNVLVADTGNDRVEKFSPGGAFLASSDETLQLDFPSHVMADAEGRILLDSKLRADPRHSGLLVLNERLQLDALTDHVGWFMTVWRNMIIAGLPSSAADSVGEVIGFDLEGNIFFRTPPADGLLRPIHAACNRGRAFIWNAVIGNERMYVLDLLHYTWTTWPGFREGVQGIAADDEGRVFVATRGISGVDGAIGGVYEYSEDGELIEKVTTAETAIVRDASAVAVNGKGELFILDWGRGEVIKLVRLQD